MEWRRLIHLFVMVFLYNFASYLVIPVIADITVAAVCVAGKDECSPAIYLTGFQQAVSGLGSGVMMPLLGNLSDVYGRKNLLIIPTTLAIIPLVTLAWKRTRNFVYAYYGFRTLTSMVTDGGVICLALGYLGDSVPESKRVGVFPVLYGVMYASNLFATLATRFLSVSQIFQVGAFSSVAALLYMIIFLENSIDTALLEQPILETSAEKSVSNRRRWMIRGRLFNGIPSPKDVFCLLNSSTTFALAASVAFFGSVADAGALSFLTYFLKARFSFNKEQFSIVFLIVNIGATLSNVFLMPIFGPSIGEVMLLRFALFSGFLKNLLDGIAWSPWVPYASASLGMFFTVWSGCVRSIISKQVRSSEQGIAQGCVMGIQALGNLISPLIFSPLSALFLSEEAPFKFLGFCMVCIGLSYLIGFILSVMIKLNQENDYSA